MSFEEINTTEKIPAEAERERLWKCFFEGVCPHCGKPVPEEHATGNLGFCNEHHLRDYQVEHSTDVTFTFEEAHGMRTHEDYCQEEADKLDITVELFKVLHDGQNLSSYEISEYLKNNKEREAA